jgi:hypothetical protein
MAHVQHDGTGASTRGGGMRQQIGLRRTKRLATSFVPARRRGNICRVKKPSVLGWQAGKS